MDCSLEFGDGEAIIKVLSKVLNKLIEVNLKSNNEQSIATKFQSSYAPEISVLGYLERIRKYARCSDACFIVALIYIDRIIEIRNVILTALNIHRILITSVLISAKFFDDEFFNNAFFAKLGGVSIWEMNSLELEFLHLVNFTLFVTTDTYDRYHRELRKYVPVDAALYSPIADYLNFNATPLLYTSPPKLHVYNNDIISNQGFIQRSYSTSPSSHVSSKRWKSSQCDILHSGGVPAMVTNIGGDISMTTSPTTTTTTHHLWSDHVMTACQAIILSPSILHGYSSQPISTDTSLAPTPPLPVLTTQSQSMRHNQYQSTTESPPVNRTVTSHSVSGMIGGRSSETITTNTVTAAAASTTTTASLVYTTPSKVPTRDLTFHKPPEPSSSQSGTGTATYGSSNSFPCPIHWANPSSICTTTTPATIPHYAYSVGTIHPEKYPCYNPTSTVLLPSEYISCYPLTLVHPPMIHTKEDLYHCYTSTTTTTKMALANNLPYHHHTPFPRIDIPLYTDYDLMKQPPSSGSITSPSTCSTSSSGTLYSPNSIYYENIHHAYSGSMSIPLPIGTREQ